MDKDDVENLLRNVAHQTVTRNGLVALVELLVTKGVISNVEIYQALEDRAIDVIPEKFDSDVMKFMQPDFEKYLAEEMRDLKVNFDPDDG